jgi:Tfp pilus assembly protein PilV
MALRRGSGTARSEAGFALIEVVVSALIMVVTTGGVISLLNATGKSGGEQRHRAHAFSLAQEDQARLRSIQIASLNTAMGARTATLNGTTYTITSKATFVSDKTSTTNCTGSNVSADYVKVGSEVTWQKMRAAPVVLESIVSPVSGSLSPNAGALAITVKNAKAGGISGARLSGSGASTFSGYTNAEGCVLFGGLPTGSYSLKPELDEEFITPNGEKPPEKPVTVSSGTTPIGLEYDRAATANFSFETRASNGTYVPSKADSVVAIATGLQSGAKAFWTSGKQPETQLKVPNLFPFNYSYLLYPGSCTANKPAAEGYASTEFAPGDEKNVSFKLPPLYLTVKNSSGVAVTGAKVTLIDTSCASAVKRTYLTEAGALPNPGLPYGTYSICASFGTKRATTSKAVQSLTGTPLTMTLPTTNTSECT